jgi:F-type H+-transporting ATPase subunit a
MPGPIEISLAAEPVFHVGSFPVTNSLLASLLASGLLTAFAVSLRTVKKIPGKIQNVAEAVLAWMLELCESVTGDPKRARQFFPLVATLFLFVLTNNWLGLLPGFGSIGVKEHGHLVPILRAGSADLNTTLALALIAFITIQVFGIVMTSARSYAGHFFNFKNPISGFVGIVELISEFAKIISFSFRLFGNVFAGEVLLVVIASLVPVFAPIPFYGLELFVGLIQAFIFAMLTLVFLTIATASHAAEEAH